MNRKRIVLLCLAGIAIVLYFSLKNPVRRLLLEKSIQSWIDNYAEDKLFNCDLLQSVNPGVVFSMSQAEQAYRADNCIGRKTGVLRKSDGLERVTFFVFQQNLKNTPVFTLYRVRNEDLWKGQVFYWNDKPYLIACDDLIYLPDQASAEKWLDDLVASFKDIYWIQMALQR